jgi:hypothetical protein
MRLEQAIWREEHQVAAPAPALSFATARLEALNIKLQAVEDREAMWYRSGDGESDECIWQAMLELGIDGNEEKAAEHEDFIATINRQVRSRGVAPHGFSSSDRHNVWTPKQL